MKSKLPACFFYLVRIPGKDDFAGAETKRVLLLAGRSGEVHNMRSKRMRKLHGHVTPPAEPGDANLLPFVMPQWRMGE